MVSEADILKRISRQPKQAAGFKQLVHEMGVHGGARSDLANKLQGLVKTGKLLLTPSGSYALPKASMDKNVVAGRLSMHRDGFGFVIPDPQTMHASYKNQITGDIFVAPHAIGNAMHGDRVLVEILNVRNDGRADGRIVRPVVRAHPTVVGIFHYGGRNNFVKAFDSKIAQEILIPAGMEKPETAVQSHDSGRDEDASHPSRKSRRSRSSVDRVIGKQAARHSDSDNLEGKVVDVEITDWPTATQNPRGRVIEVLGREDDFGVDVEITIRKFHLPHQFPEGALREAENTPKEISAEELARRKDFRDLPIVTIDGETARDFDDAVLVTELPNGNYELQVHIADVAQYVTPQSDLDQEARLRGTSVYFPDRAVPMLPLELSTDICSLRPQVDRLVLSCVMRMDRQGEIVGYELSEGVIRSAERMTYTAVNAVIEGNAEARERYAPLVTGFERMRDLALILKKKREKRGSIDFDLPEPVIEFDELGLMKSITRSERNIAHRLIEEFMLAANECVAEYLEARHIASLYRVHEKPDAKRVYDFETIAATFGYSLGVGALPIHRVQMKTDRRAFRGTGKQARTIEVPKEVHITPRMYQKLTEKIAGKPEERILSYLMLRSLKQARYSEESLGHFALATKYYTHFTSPIRRYPDLIVHRILKSVLGEGAGGVQSQSQNPHFSQSTREVGHPAREVMHPDAPMPWSKRRKQETSGKEKLSGPISTEELHEIADESSQSERRADDAERELMEWKKAKFMQDRLGEDFDGLITSVTKFGFFVEMTDLFVEGLVPLNSLNDDRYTFHENTREIIGQHSRRMFRLGQTVRVLVDRIDPVERKIQFALLEDRPPLPALSKSSPQRKRKPKRKRN